jgi:hypothetical protein
LKKYIANNLAPFQLSQKYFVLSWCKISDTENH